MRGPLLMLVGGGRTVIFCAKRCLITLRYVFIFINRGLAQDWLTQSFALGWLDHYAIHDWWRADALNAAVCVHIFTFSANLHCWKAQPGYWLTRLEKWQKQVIYARLENRTKSENLEFVSICCVLIYSDYALEGFRSIQGPHSLQGLQPPPRNLRGINHTWYNPCIRTPSWSSDAMRRGVIVKCGMCYCRHRFGSGWVFNKLEQCYVHSSGYIAK